VTFYARFRSREEHIFGKKLLSAMRFGFGGHIEGQLKKPAKTQAHAAPLKAAE
jgi:6-phosphogluconate dehydrogenase